jgi:DNA-binding transcriptional MerR regulator
VKQLADKKFMQIGEVAERTAVTQRALRFYEEKGLLKPPQRLDGGFRLYSEEDVQRVELIKKLQTLLGFSLAEIKEMVEAEETKVNLRTRYRESSSRERYHRLEKASEVTERQLALIDQKIQQMQDLRSFWEERLARYRECMAELEPGKG